MEVPEHFVAAPATNKLDDVTVNDRSEEGNGTSGAEGAGEHVLAFESYVWPAENYGGIEVLRDHGVGYVFPPTHRSHDVG